MRILMSPAMSRWGQRAVVKSCPEMSAGLPATVHRDEHRPGFHRSGDVVPPSGVFSVRSLLFRSATSRSKSYLWSRQYVFNAQSSSIISSVIGRYPHPLLRSANLRTGVTLVRVDAANQAFVSACRCDDSSKSADSVPCSAETAICRASANAMLGTPPSAIAAVVWPA